MGPATMCRRPADTPGQGPSGAPGRRGHTGRCRRHRHGATADTMGVRATPGTAVLAAPHMSRRTGRSYGPLPASRYDGGPHAAGCRDGRRGGRGAAPGGVGPPGGAPGPHSPSHPHHSTESQHASLHLAWIHPAHRTRRRAGRLRRGPDRRGPPRDGRGGRRHPHTGHRLRLEPRQPGDVRVRPVEPARPRTAGGGPARLHPVGERLPHALRLAEVRRPVGLRRGLPADQLGQQQSVLLQLVRLDQGHPWQGRGGLGDADGRHRRGAVRLGPRPYLRHRPVRRRRHGRGPARRLPGRVRRRLRRLRSARAVRHHADGRLRLPVRQPEPHPEAVGRQGPQLLPGLLGAVAAGRHLAGDRRHHRQPGQRHRTARPVDRRLGHRTDRLQHPEPDRRNHREPLRRQHRQARRRPVLDLRHDARPRREPRFGRRPVRQHGGLLPGLHLLQLPHRAVLGPGRQRRPGGRHRFPARPVRPHRDRHDRHRSLVDLEPGRRRRLLHRLPQRHQDRFRDGHLLHRHRSVRRHLLHLHRRRGGLLRSRRRVIGAGDGDDHGRRAQVLHHRQLPPGPGRTRPPEPRLHLRQRFQRRHGPLHPRRHPHPEGDVPRLLRRRGFGLLTTEAVTGPPGGRRPPGRHRPARRCRPAPEPFGT
ncbi:hypothetical protein SGPA1_41150 [Streptomyces misionensis JCM 4497]